MEYGVCKLRKLESGKYVRILGSQAWMTVDGRLDKVKASTRAASCLGDDPTVDAFILFERGEGDHIHDIRNMFSISMKQPRNVSDEQHWKSVLNFNVEDYVEEGISPSESNPHVHHGNPAVGQVWCYCTDSIKGKYIYCVVNKVDKYFMKVWYTPFGALRPHEAEIEGFMKYWIFSH